MRIASIQPLHASAADPNSSDDALRAVRRTRVPIWVYDIDHSRVVLANMSACKLWQAEDEETLCKRDMAEGMSPTVAKRLRQYQKDFIEEDATFTEMWTLYPNGEPENVMVVFSGHVLPDGRMAMLCEAVGQAEDEPQNLRSAEALLHTDVMIMLVGENGAPLYTNPAARNMLPDDGKDFQQLFVNPADHTDLAIALSATGEHRLVSQVNTASGLRWFDVSAKACSDAVTGQPAILVTAIDVSELKVARDKARYLADRDLLTGCYNRSFLQSHFNNLASLKKPPPCALVFFDVDRFKQINDRHGHEAGDTILRQISSRVQAFLGPNDLISRLGGDEFVVFLEGINSEAEVAERIKLMQSEIAKPIFQDATRINATVSIGVVLFTPADDAFADVMRRADIALYAAKEAGRDRAIHFNDDMGRAAQERDQIEDELKTALELRQFELHYQPRIDLRTGRVVSVEGLVRWNHPIRGLVMPDAFIPICEETGMIEDLGRQVLEIGCAQAIAWHQAGHDFDVSLNVSPRQFNDKHLLQTLSDLAQSPNFPSGRIELEITENVLFGDHKSIAKKLKKITHMGYRIAIDDFGTGYSNLSYISRFPLKCLKIDRSFVDQLPEAGPIVSLILTLARQIGATAVAEGVETEEQYAWLAAQNCEQAQGYYMSRPLPLDKFLETANRLNAQASE